jgi:hypothetical protein
MAGAAGCVPDVDPQAGHGGGVDDEVVVAGLWLLVDPLEGVDGEVVAEPGLPLVNPQAGHFGTSQIDGEAERLVSRPVGVDFCCPCQVAAPLVAEAVAPSPVAQTPPEVAA